MRWIRIVYDFNSVVGALREAVGWSPCEGARVVDVRCCPAVSKHYPRDYAIVFRRIQAMVTPFFKSVLSPLLSTSVTVPVVVGVHARSSGVPAVADSPPCGILNGLGCAASAKSGALKSATMVANRKYIVEGQTRRKSVDKRMRARRIQTMCRKECVAQTQTEPVPDLCIYTVSLRNGPSPWNHSNKSAGWGSRANGTRWM